MLDESLNSMEQTVVATDENEHDSQFALRPLSLDKATAPLLRKPIAPFDRTERKRAYTSALFYSECFIHGIEPKVADTAALHAQGVYDKWWVKFTASCSESESAEERGQRTDTTAKKQKFSTPDMEKISKHRDFVCRSSTPETSDLSSDDSPDEGKGDTSSESSECNTTSLQNGNVISSFPLSPSNIDIEFIKEQMIEDLRLSGGNVTTRDFLKYQSILEAFYIQNRLQDIDLDLMEGNWLTISKPTFTECKGENERGEKRYSLGRISFDMFKPTGLSCSFQASFNHIQEIDPNNPGRPLYVPRKLMREIQQGNCRLKTYDIITAITIEGGQDRKGNIDDQQDSESYIIPRSIRAILTTHGYSIPDPSIPNRLSVWFSGGSLEVQDEENDLEEWKKIFDTASAPNRDIREYANNLAARLILGAHIPDKLEHDGTLRFDLKRPIGGHGSVFCDVIYMDENLRIMHGHHDSVYVCVRVPDSAN